MSTWVRSTMLPPAWEEGKSALKVTTYKERGLEEKWSRVTETREPWVGRMLFYIRQSWRASTIRGHVSGEMKKVRGELLLSGGRVLLSNGTARVRPWRQEYSWHVYKTARSSVDWKRKEQGREWGREGQRESRRPVGHCEDFGFSAE